MSILGLEISIHRYHYQVNVCKVDSSISTEVIHIRFNATIIIKNRKKKGKKL